MSILRRSKKGNFKTGWGVWEGGKGGRGVKLGVVPPQLLIISCCAWLGIVYEVGHS